MQRALILPMGLFGGLRHSVVQPDRGTRLFSFDRPRRIPELPDKMDTPVVYEIIGGLVVAQVQQGLYRVVEPEFTDREKETYRIIQQGLFEILSIDTAEDPIPYIEKCTRVLLSELDLRVSEDFLNKIVYFIHRDPGNPGYVFMNNCFQNIFEQLKRRCLMKRKRHNAPADIFGKKSSAFHHVPVPAPFNHILNR